MSKDSLNKRIHEQKKSTKKKNEQIIENAPKKN